MNFYPQEEIEESMRGVEFTSIQVKEKVRTLLETFTIAVIWRIPLAVGQDSTKKQKSIRKDVFPTFEEMHGI